jgi:hypothetical protein
MPGVFERALRAANFALLDIQPDEKARFVTARFESVEQ